VREVEIRITGLHTCLNCECEMNCRDFGKLLCSEKCMNELNAIAKKQGVGEPYDLEDVK
jgi:hypothetical protein